MPGTRRIVVVGAGAAGTMAGLAAKRQDPSAEVVLLTEESCEPYEKPPLSKAVLLGTASAADAPIAGPQGVTGHGVELLRNLRCSCIDRGGREVRLDDGQRLGYDALVLATGSRLRELSQLPAAHSKVHYLRTERDAASLKPALVPGCRLLVVGGGLIGLEVASSAAQLGLRVTVLEIAARILLRVCDEDTAAVVARVHTERGVDLRLNTTVEAVSTDVGGAVVVDTAGGERLHADVVVVGVGVAPNDRLARDAGLTTEDGIVVDEECRTSDAAIFAAGDASRFPGPRGLLRLENWKHAQDQGVVAGANAAGARQRYQALPSFWSEQYDLYIQGVGWPDVGGTHVRRQVNARSTLAFTVADGRVTYAMGINAQRDVAIARRLIDRQAAVDPAALADSTRPLGALLKG